MREILYRGKRIDNKKWIEGCYAVVGEKKVIIAHPEMFYDENAKQCYGSEIKDIDPETVCQYIGMTDKNGRKIFEGDIIEVCTFGFNPERFITEVAYDKCAFRLKNGRNMFYYGQSDFTKMDDAKVIGNIFDNPELL